MQPNMQELTFAKEFISTKMDSVRKDVEHCLKLAYAPMPAILWCLSCVDLLGALLAGQASKFISGTNKRVNIIENTQNYMSEYMEYDSTQIKLILEVFRHKLVHLAQPAPLSSYNGKTVAWMYIHENNPLHLRLVDLHPPIVQPTTPGNNERIDQVFVLSINQFMEDIRKSVFKSGGYLEKLETYTDIQMKCWSAIKDIHKPQTLK